MLYNVTMTLKITSISTRRPIIILIFFALIGVLMSYGTYRMWDSQRSFIRSSIESEGRVIDLKRISKDEGSDTYAPVITYTQNGISKDFTSNVSSNPPSYSIGEMVPILISTNGGVPKVNTFWSLWMGVIIFSVFSTLFILIALATAAIMLGKRKKLALLTTQGTVIQANQVSVFADVMYKNSEASYKIKAQWLNPRDNTVYIFYSEPLSYNPQQFIKDTIDVTILPSNPKIYKMHTSDIPQAV